MANLLDEASILLSATAYNNGSMLAVKPENGDGDFTFSRNSAATRVNAQGLVENVQILSSNLVSNGDFSQEGAQEVSNGSFSQEGSEQVTNGDFATDSDWTISGGNAQISNGKLNLTNAVIYGTSVNNSATVVSGKTYLVKYTISDYVGGSSQIRLGSQFGTSRNSNGTFSEYIVANDTAIRIYSSSSNTTLSIDNVSVKEVGQDWNLNNGAAIAEDKATIIGDGSVFGYVEQLSTFVSGKKYKVTLDAIINSGGGLVVKYALGFSANIGSITTSGSYTFYYTAGVSGSIIIGRSTGGVAYNLSVTNISVKEVGQDWTLGGSGSNTASIGSNSATITSVDGNSYIQQNSVLTSGKSYKISYEILSSSGSSVLKMISSLGLATVPTTVGTHTVYGTAVSTTFYIERVSNGMNATITNISILEITNDTNLPRINYEGFSYQDSLGSEEIVNGDFATDSDWSKTLGWSIGSGTANCDGSQTGNTYLTSQSENAIIGKTYIISFTTSNITSGWVRARVGGVNTSDLISTNGQYAYTVTATASTDICRVQGSVDFNGSIDNVSVKEYLGQQVIPSSGCGSWLMENQSTNLITQSELFSDSSWTKQSGIVLTSNSTISPDGTNNATKVTGNGTVGIYTSAPVTGLVSRSIYIKSVVGNVNVVLKDPTLTVTSKSVLVTENWQRFELVENNGNSSSSGLWVDDIPSSGIYIWGAQLEQSSYATSYIPTQGASSTRLQDIATNSGNASLINSEEGVLYAETHNVAKGVASVISLTDGGNNQRVMIYFNNDLTLYFYIRVNSSYEAIFVVPSSEINFEDTNKIAIKYKTNDMSFWLNGTKVGADTTGTMFSPNTLTQLGFNSGSGGAFYGNTKALAVYKTALTDAQLTLLTTI